MEEVTDFLIERLYDNGFFDDYKTEKMQLRDICIETIETGKSNFVVVVDRTRSRVSITSEILEEIKKSKKYDGNYEVITLADFVHTTDQLVIEEIARHFNLECPQMDVGGSLKDCLDFVLKGFRDSAERKAIVVVVHGSHKFCNDHQQLVYNLFNLVHDSIPICFIIVAADSSFQEKLGKRESSRFSHKAIVIDPELSISRKLKIFRDSLLVDTTFSNKLLAAKWNKHIEQLCTDDLVLKSLEQCEDMREGDFRSNVLWALLCYRSKLVPSYIQETIAAVIPSSIQTFLSDLSSADLCMIITICHEISISCENKFNFRSIYTRYTKAANSSSMFPRISSSKALHVFERLKVKGFIESLALDNKHILRETIPYQLLICVDEIKDFVTNNANISDEIKEYMSNSLFSERSL